MAGLLGIDDDAVFDDLGELEPGELGGDEGDGGAGGEGDGKKPVKDDDTSKRLGQLEKMVKDQNSHISRVESENKDLRDRLTGHTKTKEEIEAEEENKVFSERLMSGDTGAVKELVAKAVGEAVKPVSERVDATAADAIGDRAIKSISRLYEFPFKDAKIMEKLKKELGYIPLAAKQQDPKGAILRACKALDDGKHLKKRETPLFEHPSTKRTQAGKTAEDIAKQDIINAPKRHRVLEI